MALHLISEEARKWWTLAAVAFGLFMIMLDNTVVNVALPSIAADLRVDLSELEWIVTGYALTFASLMLTGGKLADLLGRRLIFVIGLAIFTGSSLACGLAESGSFLIGARVVQGVGAALMNPATLSIIAATFPPAQRGMAIGIWAGVSALALAIGPLVGGLLTEHLNWSWIFFVNVPVGIVAIVASFVLIRESKDESLEQRLDLPGLASSAIGLFALTYGLIEANTYGWTSGRIVLAFAIAVAGLVTFVLLERHQRLPMLDLSLFRNRTFAGANLAILLVALAMFGVQLVYFSRQDQHSTYLDLFPGLILGGIGMALVMTPSAAAAVRALPVDKSGVGSAVLNAFRQVGGSVGIALMGAIMAHEVGGLRGPQVFRNPDRFVDGFSTSLLVAAGIAVVGAIVAFVLVRHEPVEAEQTEALAEVA